MNTFVLYTMILGLWTGTVTDHPDLASCQQAARENHLLSNQYTPVVSWCEPLKDPR
jgi:uncharacterized transporter YbjL